MPTSGQIIRWLGGFLNDEETYLAVGDGSLGNTEHASVDITSGDRYRFRAPRAGYSTPTQELNARQFSNRCQQLGLPQLSRPKGGNRRSSRGSNAILLSCMIYLCLLASAAVGLYYAYPYLLK
jgi:hypothetical protein